VTGEITYVVACCRSAVEEKLLAAHRGGIRIVIIPDENARDLKEIPDNIKRSARHSSVSGRR
jgi:ATP-dependent Lon protease